MCGFDSVSSNSVINSQVACNFQVSHLYAAQKMKFSIKGYFCKCKQICRKLWICSHLLNKSSIENVIFYVGCVGRISS